VTYNAAFAETDATDIAGIVVLGDPLTVSNQDQIAELAIKHRQPAIFQFQESIAAGGLMSYGATRDQLYQRAADYVDKILKGAKPADLPVQQPTKFELVINLKTAAALGLTVAESLLLRADEVIE
jgi:putative ABC transport system substrate-binding protein